ncbi:MAG: DUF3108 domain-containing protein [Tannerellaceae bacterium]|nr:DUF3108 domain-containing protein [Tannerellaceae bacterium]
MAQCKVDKKLFHHGEEVNYDIYFKWGLLMPKAGHGTFRMKNTQFESQKAWNYSLVFRTNGFAERVYKMRDTLECYFSPDLNLLYSSKRTNEKNYYLVENINFTYQGNNVRTHTHRYNLETTRIDTTIVTPGCVLDMIGATMYLRSIDWSNLKNGDEFPFKVAIGKDIVNIGFRYSGQQIVERNETLKYRTRHFFVDIFDDAFEVSKAAAEVWIGDDENHIPVKVRAKLKIGAAEVYYHSSRNLQYPFTSRVEIGR